MVVMAAVLDMAVADMAVVATMEAAATTVEVAIGAVAIMHPAPTSTWRLSPTSMRRHRATGPTTTGRGTRGRSTTAVRLRHLASVSFLDFDSASGSTATTENCYRADANPASAERWWHGLEGLGRACIEFSARPTALK